MEPDKTDMRLLYELDTNCRQSMNSIAKKLRISRNVALYRLNRLKEQGIITGTFAEINNMALGYYSFRLLMKLSHLAKEDEKKLVRFILAQKNTIFLSKVLEGWDLDLVYMTKDVFKFNDFKEDLFLRFNKILEDTHISMLTQIYHYPKDYLVGKERKQVKRKTLRPRPIVEVDETDEKLLRILAWDAQESILSIAKKLEVSVNTVKKRMRELERKGVILGYRLAIDTNKLGYHYYKLHLDLRHYTKQDLSLLRGFLESKNYIVYTDHYLTSEEFEIELQLKDEKEYIAFMDELMETFGRIIKKHFVLKFYKEYLFRYLPEE